MLGKGNVNIDENGCHSNSREYLIIVNIDIQQ